MEEPMSYEEVEVHWHLHAKNRLKIRGKVYGDRSQRADGLWGLRLEIGGEVLDTSKIFGLKKNAIQSLKTLYRQLSRGSRGHVYKYKYVRIVDDLFTGQKLTQTYYRDGQYDWEKWRSFPSYYMAKKFVDFCRKAFSIAINEFLFPDPRIRENPWKEIEQPDGWNNFQMGNNEHQTAVFTGEVDPKWVVKLKGQNNEHLLFRSGQGRGRYTLDQWKSFLQNVKDNGFIPKDNGSFIIVEFGEDGRKLKVIKNLVYDEMVNKRGYDEWAYPMEEAATLVDPDRDIIATIYEGNHRARIAYQLGIPLPVEVRFFGGSERFLEDAKRSSPLGLVYQMMKETGAI